jgi:hypothetical protein
LRKTATAIALALTVTMTTPAHARITPDAPAALTRRAAHHRLLRDWWAIGVLVAQFQSWIAALPDPAPTYPFTGPECPGTWPIPTSIIWRESHCNPTAENPTSTASGFAQMIDQSWRWAARQAGISDYGGHASWAPLAAQKAAAAELWADSPCHWAPNAWC